jgi:hypothetical protein
MKSFLGGIEANMIQTLGSKFEVENVLEDNGDTMLLITIVKFDDIVIQRHELDLMPMYQSFEKRLK